MPVLRFGCSCMCRLRFERCWHQRGQRRAPPPPPPQLIPCCSYRRNPHKTRSSAPIYAQNGAEIYLDFVNSSRCWVIEVEGRQVYRMLPNALDPDYASCPNVDGVWVVGDAKAGVCVWVVGDAKAGVCVWVVGDAKAGVCGGEGEARQCVPS